LQKEDPTIAEMLKPLGYATGQFGKNHLGDRNEFLKNVGTVLQALDELGIADNTFVMYSTDNGPHMNSWPDAAMTPFRNEKNSNWEGAYRVPCMVRWPGKIKPGQISNEIVAHLDWLPTLVAMAGDTEVKDKLLKGYKVGDMTYKVHLDGDNLVPYLTSQAEKSPRESFLYCNDDQQLTALRYDNWKLVFMAWARPLAWRSRRARFRPWSLPTQLSRRTTRRWPISSVWLKMARSAVTS
jgi:arylsulfatase